jgi:hypothetical protein
MQHRLAAKPGVTGAGCAFVLPMRQAEPSAFALPDPHAVLGAMR